VNRGERLYRTGAVLTRTVRIAYPVGDGRLVLRTELDWHRDLEPVAVDADGTSWTFEVEADQPFLYFKPCLVRDGRHHWSVGPNKLLLMTEDDRRVLYPFFFDSGHGRVSRLVEMWSTILGRAHRLRVYLPPGYDENTLATYPVAFMQDGQNLFFPEEAFLGRDWDVGATCGLLWGMSAVDGMIFVGIYSGDRMRDYTQPGYEPYGRSLADEIVPEVQRFGRAIDDRRYRSVSAAWSRSTARGSIRRCSASASACRAPSRTATTSSSGCSPSRRATWPSTSTAAGRATTTR
jgi:hypothetical protein